jgi:hypothetical protein
MIVYAIKGKYSREYDDFISDCLNHLLPRAPKHDVNIHVRFKKLLKNRANSGECVGDVGEVTIDLARFRECDDGTMWEFTKTELAANLAHELVHAKQYILDEINAVDYTWKSNDFSDCGYYDQPWEIEAYHREVILVKRYWKGDK